MLPDHDATQDLVTFVALASTFGLAVVMLAIVDAFMTWNPTLLLYAFCYVAWRAQPSRPFEPLRTPLEVRPSAPDA